MVIRRDVKDAAIPNSVNTDAVEKMLQANPLVARFVKEGKELLESTNRPNVITAAQFLPFLPLFTMSDEDKERYKKDRPHGPYAKQMEALYKRYIRELGINLHQPTVVMRSREEPVEELVLPALFSRIQSDHVEGESARNHVPSVVARTATTTRDQMFLEAALHDLVQANNTPEQKANFARMKIESSLIEKRFVERNLNPEKRKELMGETSLDSGGTPASPISSTTTLLDDDDD